MKVCYLSAIYVVYKDVNDNFTTNNNKRFL